jgi:malonyl-CoA O-methyltransferase
VKRYPKAQCYVHEATDVQRRAAALQFQQAWWKPERWLGASPVFAPPPQPVQMLWANMALHMEGDPQALIARWHAALAVDGFLMFSCLGPDTLRELRPVFADKGWSAPSHAFTDMHDWGDMLVQAGFGEPIMDMERITLTYSSAEKLLEELRELGRNLLLQRFAGLRGREWHRQLIEALEQRLRGSDGRLPLTFEVIYGHAFKPARKLTVASETRVSMDEMRRSLRQIKP